MCWNRELGRRGRTNRFDNPLSLIEGVLNVPTSAGLPRFDRGFRKCDNEALQGLKATNGAILGRAGVDGRPSGVLSMKIISQCREQARRVYYGAVFEIKKEILS